MSKSKACLLIPTYLPTHLLTYPPTYLHICPPLQAYPFIIVVVPYLFIHSCTLHTPQFGFNPLVKPSSDQSNQTISAPISKVIVVLINLLNHSLSYYIHLLPEMVLPATGMPDPLPMLLVCDSLNLFARFEHRISECSVNNAVPSPLIRHFLHVLACVGVRPSSKPLRLFCKTSDAQVST